MTGRVAALWRHPIKSHGRETLERTALQAGRTMPWDRRWAVAHEAARIDGPGWAPCANFSRAAKAPGLMAISAISDTGAGTVTLRHPELPELCLDPDHEGDRLIDWVRPIMPEGRAQPARVVRAEGRGMTDTDFPSLALNNMASHRAVEGRLGRKLSPQRWRGNLWFDGLAPWEEFDWIGRTLRIGTAELTVRERIGRCLATAANPETGRRDADTLGVLNEGWGHQDFGVYAEVTRTGDVALGDTVEVL